MDSKAYYSIVSDAWKFFRKWYEKPELTGIDWDDIVNEANAAVKAYRGQQIERYVADTYNAAVSELERVKT